MGRGMELRHQERQPEYRPQRQLKTQVPGQVGKTEKQDGPGRTDGIGTVYTQYTLI